MRLFIKKLLGTSLLIWVLVFGGVFLDKVCAKEPPEISPVRQAPDIGKLFIAVQCFALQINAGIRSRFIEKTGRIELQEYDGLRGQWISRIVDVRDTQTLRKISEENTSFYEERYNWVKSLYQRQPWKLKDDLRFRGTNLSSPGAESRLALPERIAGCKAFTKNVNKLGTTDYLESYWTDTYNGLNKIRPFDKQFLKEISPQKDLSQQRNSISNFAETLNKPGGVLFDKGNTYLFGKDGTVKKIKESALKARPEKRTIDWEFQYLDQKYKAVAIPLGKKEKSQQRKYTLHHNDKQKIITLIHNNNIIVIKYSQSGNYFHTLEAVKGKVIGEKKQELLFKVNEILFSDYLPKASPKGDAINKTNLSSNRACESPAHDSPIESPTNIEEISPDR